MMYGRQGKMLMLLLGGCLVAGIAGASNITISDGMSGNPYSYFYPAGSDYDNWWQANPYGEDQEVEPGCQIGQQWDLEGMFLGAVSWNINSDPNTLTLVGGWDFVDGLFDDGHQLLSGDIFISIDPAGPVYGDPGIASTNMKDYRYNYVIDVDWAKGRYTVWTNAGEGDVPTPVDIVLFEQNYGANPWARNGGGTEIASGAGTFSMISASDAQTGFIGGTHNSVSFDLTWLAGILGEDATTTPMWFHFTEECGNDNLMGNLPGGWQPGPITPPGVVPEPASMGILGMGLLGLIATRLRKK